MIVHGVLTLDVGGLERIVVSLAKPQPAAVLCVQEPGTLAAELQAAGVEVMALNKPPGRHPEYGEAAWDALQKLKTTVLHTHQIGAAWYLAPAAKRLGLRVVHTEHGNPFARAGWLESLRMRLLLKAAAKSIDAVAAVSAEIATTLPRWGTLPSTKVTVVPNGIEIVAPVRSRAAMRAALGIPADAFVIGTVGRLNEVKRQHLLLKAITRTEYYLLVVGEGPERSRLESLAATLGVDSRVRFAGYQPQTSDFYAAMDVFALSSRSEGFPVSLLEAWAAKLPAVVAGVGGLPAIVQHRVNGEIIIDSNDPSAYRSAFDELREPDYSRSLGEGGYRSLRENYTLDRMIARYKSLYSEVVESSP